MEGSSVEMEGSVFTSSVEGMKHVKSKDGVMLAKPFLDVCKLILPLLGIWLVLLSISLLFLYFPISVKIYSNSLVSQLHH